ncbi:hypothetical protein GCM10011379_34550 [Filimonas zeae]|uniref:DUF1684 domain-containing protein n=2 Tax=Filimonas zeae TaxID=1737353 RepID=A0A917MXG5_9BACT|nr:hypothetical protein GCM10011379_34550 [Filimonas zeae]
MSTYKVGFMKQTASHQLIKHLLLLPALGMVTHALAQDNEVTTYRQEVEAWHQNREDELKKKDGWLSLVGLYWLKEGSNSFGADSSNAIVFPKNFPERQGGSYMLDKGKIAFHLNNAAIKVSGYNGTDRVITVGEADRQPVRFAIDGFQWIIIRRQDKYGLRVWDTNSPAVKQFTGVPRFPVDTAWRIPARFIAAESEGGPILFKNKIGQSFENKAVGKIAFSYKGAPYTLDIISASREGYFIVFGDKTSGEQTYASGRFITVDKADDAGNTYIDFNRAINPPCVFTEYATCPLPPQSNVLPVAILAGEKDYHIH